MAFQPPAACVVLSFCVPSRGRWDSQPEADMNIQLRTRSSLMLGTFRDRGSDTKPPERHVELTVTWSGWMDRVQSEKDESHMITRFALKNTQGASPYSSCSFPRAHRIPVLMNFG